MTGLLGRAQECGALDNAVARARRGQGVSIIVTGGPEPGSLPCSTTW
jgi:hypothetical protein